MCIYIYIYTYSYIYIYIYTYVFGVHCAESRCLWDKHGHTLTSPNLGTCLPLHSVFEFAFACRLQFPANKARCIRGSVMSSYDTSNAWRSCYDLLRHAGPFVQYACGNQFESGATHRHPEALLQSLRSLLSLWGETD